MPVQVLKLLKNLSETWLILLYYSLCCLPKQAYKHMSLFLFTEPHILLFRRPLPKGQQKWIASLKSSGTLCIYVGSIQWILEKNVQMSLPVHELYYSQQQSSEQTKLAAMVLREISFTVNKCLLILSSVFNKVWVACSCVD